MAWATRTLGGLLPIAIAALLGACATSTSELPPPLSNDEMAEIRQHESDAHWDYVVGTHPGTPRPGVAFVEYVTGQTADLVRSRCMLREGFDLDAPFEETQDPTEVADFELAIYVCATRYPFDPQESGYLSGAQARFAYEYLTTRIVPCLRTLGYIVPPPPPEDEFVANHGSGWTPYLSLDPQTVREDIDFIDFHCPPLLAEPYDRIFRPGP